MGAAELAQDGAMTIDGAASFLGLGRTSIYAMLASGKLRSVRLSGRRLIPRVELRRVLAEVLAETECEQAAK